MIHISKTPDADSRSANEELTVETLTTSTEHHISDVLRGMLFFKDELLFAMGEHDRTKLDAMPEFFEALTSGKIKESEWYQRHITEERHHLLSHAPDDVNLIDVIHHITDCVMAGLARTGEVYDVEFPPELLEKATKNTVDLLKSRIQVHEEDIHV